MRVTSKRRRWHPRPSPLLGLLVLLGASGAGARSVTPVETSEPLQNPGMGWVLEEAIAQASHPERAACRGETAPGTFTDPFPLVDTYEIIASWAEVERQEGIYDWSRIDEAIAFWHRRFGKRIRLRVSTESLGCYACSDPDSVGIPVWLKAKVPIQVRVNSDNGVFEFPDYRHPVYREALERFLGAYAERYRSHPAVDAVDLRGYGMWGEWHSGHDLASVEERRQVLGWIIDAWYDAWNPGDIPSNDPPRRDQKILALSNSYEWREDLKPTGVAISNCSLPGGYDAYKQNSAFDHAWTKRLLTFRRDGIGGAVCPNLDGRLLLEAFESRPQALPLIMEFFGTYQYFKSAGTVQAAFDEALAYRGNYVTLMGWQCDVFDADTFYTERQDLILKGLSAGGMGYRFVLHSASFPDTLVPGGSWTIQQVWINRNVGRSYVNHPLRVYLIDACGRPVWSGLDRSFDPRGFVQGRDYQVSSNFTLPTSVPPGRYDLRIALVDPSTGEPAVRLAIGGRDSQGRYSLGEVIVDGPAGSPPFCLDWLPQTLGLLGP